MHPVAVSCSRRTLTRAQRSDAAARNVQGLGSVHEVARLAVDLIRDAGSGRRALPPPIRAAIERRGVAIRKPSSSIAGNMPDGNPEAIRGHLLGLASPSGNDDVLTWVVSDWLQDRLDAHAVALDDLRATYPDLYRALFASTLDKAVRIGKRTNIDRARLARLLGDQARFLLVGAAHDRIAHIRRLATSPHGGLFCGFNHWKFAGHDVGGIEQRRADAGVAGAADAAGDVGLARLIASGCGTEVGADQLGGSEARRIVDRRAHSQRGHGTDAGNGHEASTDIVVPHDLAQAALEPSDLAA